MPATLLGLLLLVCPGTCAVPLPGATLQVSVQATQWQWCLQASSGGGWRICADDWQPRTRRRLEQVLQRLRADAGVSALAATRPSASA